MSHVHPLARTTPRTRAEIKASSSSLTGVAERFDITVATARKWTQRDSPQDRSHRPHKLSTTLSPAQELLTVELRRTLLLPLDDLLGVIKTILTDNGSQFTDRFTSKARTPSGKHVFDLACKSMDIEHRLCPPRHPQSNGMVERFNGRTSELMNQTRFKSAAELDLTLAHYWSTYNHLVPQRALGHTTPLQALKDWHAKRPDLFVKRVHKQPGLDRHQNLRAAMSA